MFRKCRIFTWWKRLVQTFHFSDSDKFPRLVAILKSKKCQKKGSVKYQKEQQQKQLRLLVAKEKKQSSPNNVEC